MAEATLRVVAVASLAGATLVAAADCEKPLHPNDPAIPGEICGARCEREHECTPDVDVASCVTHCVRRRSPRDIYSREDLVGALVNCSRSQPCTTQIDHEISSCESDVRSRQEPSPTAKTFCQRYVERSFKCGDYRWDEAHCLAGHKGYSDAILGQLSDCLEHPCHNYARCLVAVVGEDPVWEDDDRVKEFRSQPVDDSPRKTVAIQGRVGTEAGAPIPGVEVCLVQPKPVCTTPSASGAFSIPVPPHAEVPSRSAHPATPRPFSAS